MDLLKIFICFSLLLPFSAACASYGESYSLPSNPCCAGLVEDNGKCNQIAGVCTNMPEEYVIGSNAPANPGMPGGPVAVTGQLASGGGIGSAPGPNAPLGEGSGIYRVGWFNGWQTAGFIGLAISIAIIAVGAMFGYGFNVPEAKAFARSELEQAIMSALLLMGIIALIGFFDVVARGAIDAADLPVSCVAGEPCYVSAAKQYLTTVYDISAGYSKNQLKEAVKLGRTSSGGYSVNVNYWLFLFAGTNSRPNAGVSIETERASAVFETASRLMAGIYAQIYFIDVIAYGIAPVFLLLGIILRTFFFTRKLGGLLLAIAIALFIVYPLTYAFAWYTLNVTVYGERAITPSDPSCPEECTAKPPAAFYVNPGGELVSFPSAASVMRAGINASNWNSGDVDGDGNPEFVGLVACANLSSESDLFIGVPDSCSSCPEYCRETPLPNLPGCNATLCAACNPGCKIMRQRTDCASDCASSCQDNLCKLKLPIENKCAYEPGGIVRANLTVSCAGCEGCPAWCKLLRRNPDGSLSQAYADEAACQKPACFPPELVVSGTSNHGTCPTLCMYETSLGPSTLCNSEGMCKGCPEICRVIGLVEGDPHDTTSPTLYSLCNSAENAAACSTCPDACKTELPSAPQAPCAEYPPYPAPQHCVECPMECRWEGYGYLEAGGKFAPYSQTELDSDSVPRECPIDEVSCGQANCGADCKGEESGPVFCREYSASGDDAWCGKCPENARIMLEHTDASGATTQFLPSLPTQYKCGNEKCPHESCFYDQAAAFPIPAQPHEAERSCTKSENERCDMNAESENCCTLGLECTRTNTGITVIVPHQLDSHREEASEPRVLFRTDIDSEVVTTIISCKACGTTLGFGDACTPANAGCCPAGGECIGGMCRPYCKDYDHAFSGTPHKCELCPESCRVNGAVSAYLSSSECAMCGEENCPLECKVEAESVQGTVCAEYLGNGPEGETGFCVGSSASCDSQATWNACMAISGCYWNEGGSPYAVPINLRESPYNERSSCKQCPENFRLKDESGNPYEISNAFVDCSAQNCPSACRTGVKIDPIGGMCEPYANPGECHGCPAFCRLEGFGDDATGQEFAALCETYPGCQECSASCRIESAPRRVCDACFDCSSDCLYKPATRTDCSEVCTDDDLSGTMTAGPADFAKKLPGAEGRSDVAGVGVLMLPALVLPLFCMVMTIAFIRVLSPLLGGDVEIPGLGRII